MWQIHRKDAAQLFLREPSLSQAKLCLTIFRRRVRRGVERSAHRWRLLRDFRIANRRRGAAIRCNALIGELLC